MLAVVYKVKFNKDVEKALKRGKNIKKLKEVISLLVHEQPLPPKYRNHKLIGNYQGYWECHVEPDWLLIYKITVTEITFARTGTHSDLF
jgi:mRNA interferase YafQ